MKKRKLKTTDVWGEAPCNHLEHEHWRPVYFLPERGVVIVECFACHEYFTTLATEITNRPYRGLL